MKNESFFNTNFYIVPHADDWQLFMNPETYSDIISPHNKVVFIITTAGDAGKEERFWRAREEGMKASVLYSLSSLDEIKTREGCKIINDLSVAYWSANNTVSYFLRLPDGGITGEGFKKNNFRNLEKFENGSISSLSSLDKSFTLPSWVSFCNLLKKIIALESAGKIFIKFLDPDEKDNSSDHADHYCTGRAILSPENLPACTKILFRGYGNSCSTVLTSEEIFWKAGIFAVYENTLYEKTGYRTLSEDINIYKKWIISRPEFKVMKTE